MELAILTVEQGYSGRTALSRVDKLARSFLRSPHLAGLSREREARASTLEYLEPQNIEGLGRLRHDIREARRSEGGNNQASCRVNAVEVQALASLTAICQSRPSKLFPRINRRISTHGNQSAPT